jgi:broad-specificity NMP kinase
VTYPRVIIGGGPGTGKSTLAARLGGEPGVVLRSTDELISTHEWSAASEEVARWFDDTAVPFVIEGVATCRAIRKWLKAHPDGLPADFFVWLTITRVKLEPRAAGLGKGCEKVWREILPELRRRGARIFTDTDGELPSFARTA